MAGYIIYEGASVLDGAPIVMIATTGTSNQKTGDMVQTWIIRSDISPLEASKTGLDSSVCGGCPLRHHVGGACYVQLFQAPLNIYKAYKAGKYKKLDLEEAQHFSKYKKIRLGAYGDPAAVPYQVWENLLQNSLGYTGYTHQISHKNFDSRILDFVMVSSETAKQSRAFWGKGLRTFRVVTDYNQLASNEIICPSESGVSCYVCGLCNGAKLDKPNIAILVHGMRSKKHTEKYGNLIKAVNI